MHVKTKNRVFNYICMRRLLVALNGFYMILGLIIATMPVYFHVNKMLSSWPITGGIIAMGSLLVILAILGCYGSNKQHQVILFFYMIILSVICIMAFAFSISCISLSQPQQSHVLKAGWNQLSNETRADFQGYGNCCGFEVSTNSGSCVDLPCYKTKDKCPPCEAFLKTDWFIGFRRAVGGFTLFVSLLMMLGIYSTAKFRNYKNPVANPDDFL